MANFPRVNPAGWAPKAELTHDQANNLDIDHTKAPNFDDGSTHSPATQIVVSGAGFKFGGPVAFDTGSAPHLKTGVTFTTDAGSTLDILGVTHFDGNTVTVDNGGSLTIANGIVFNMNGNLQAAAGSFATLDNTAITAKDLSMVAGTNVKLNTRSIPRVQHGVWTFLAAAWHWVMPGSGGNFGIESDIVGDFARFSIRVSHGQVLTAVSVRWKGKAGHAAFPGGAPTMPKVELFKLTNGVTTSLGSVSDPSATAGAYEAWHAITLSGLNITIDRSTYEYFIVFSDETNGGGVGLAGGDLGNDVKVTYAASSYDED